MNWTPGPARCQNPECKAIILGMHGNLYVGVAWLQSSPEEWNTMLWTENGHSNTASSYDLMPPIITREALATEVMCMHEVTGYLSTSAWRDVVAHVIDAVKAGRVE